MSDPQDASLRPSGLQATHHAVERCPESVPRSWSALAVEVAIIKFLFWTTSQSKKVDESVWRIEVNHKTTTNHEHKPKANNGARTGTACRGLRGGQYNPGVRHLERLESVHLQAELAPLSWPCRHTGTSVLAFARATTRPLLSCFPLDKAFRFNLGVGPRYASIQVLRAGDARTSHLHGRWIVLRRRKRRRTSLRLAGVDRRVGGYRGRALQAGLDPGFHGRLRSARDWRC